MKNPTNPEKILETLATGQAVGLVGNRRRQDRTIRIVEQSPYEIADLNDKFEFSRWLVNKEPYGAHIDRLRIQICADPKLLEFIYSLRGKLIKTPAMDYTLAITYYINNFTPDELKALPKDHEVQHHAKTGHAQLALERFKELMAKRKAERKAAGNKDGSKGSPQGTQPKGMKSDKPFKQSDKKPAPFKQAKPESQPDSKFAPGSKPRPKQSADSTPPPLRMGLRRSSEKPSH